MIKIYEKKNKKIKNLLVFNFLKPNPIIIIIIFLLVISS